jgi:hypothetical protein
MCWANRTFLSSDICLDLSPTSLWCMVSQSSPRLSHPCMVSPTILNSSGSRVQDRPYRGYLYPPKTNYISRLKWPGTTLYCIDAFKYTLWTWVSSPLLAVRPVCSSATAETAGDGRLTAAGNEQTLQNGPILCEKKRTYTINISQHN